MKLKLIFITLLILSFSPFVFAEPKINIPEEDSVIPEPEEDKLNRFLDRLGRFHIFGYGEVHYNGNVGAASTNEVDFHRMVLGLGYDFNEWLEFRMELDFEHAFTEPELEYAYLDFLIKDSINIRAGSVLVPMGVMNQHHEPPLFNGVERPELYTSIIPTSWMEFAVGIHGKLFESDLSYEFYVLSMPAAAVVDGGNIDRSFTGGSGIRGGRGKVAEAPGRDLGVGGRLQYTGINGLRLGVSSLIGNTGHGDDVIDGGLLFMVEADAKYSFNAFDIEGIIALNSLSDADNINTLLITTDPTFNNFVGSKMLGWYIEGAYHILKHIAPSSTHDVILFARYEDIDTQYEMPAGFAKNDVNDRNRLTMGITYKPIEQVAIKFDYSSNWNAANSGVDTYNFGVGFYY